MNKSKMIVEVGGRAALEWTLRCHDINWTALAQDIFGYVLWLESQGWGFCPSSGVLIN
jgi:hypothetical protein